MIDTCGRPYEKKYTFLEEKIHCNEYMGTKRRKKYILSIEEKMNKKM